MPHVARESAASAPQHTRTTVGDTPFRQPHTHGAPAGSSLAGEPESDSVPTLRRWLNASLEAQADRITAEIHALMPAQRNLPGAGWLAGVAIVACAAALVAAGFSWSDHTRLQAAQAELVQLRQLVAAQSNATGAPAPVASAPASSPASSTSSAEAPQAGSSQGTSQLLVLQVPYGADALGGSRLAVIRQTLDRLVADHITGVVQIRTFAGRFCLKGDPVNGYALAPVKTPFAQCDVVGNPADDALPPAQRMPLALANLIAGIRDSTHGALDVETSVGDPATLRTPYPAVTDELTAGEWNRAGKANNRVEILVR